MGPSSGKERGAVERQADIESRLRALEREVAELRALVTALGASPADASDVQISRATAVAEAPEPADAAPTATPLGLSPAVQLGTLAGRTCLVLGGGYLLRALVEGGAVAPIVGVSLGLAYAAAWHVVGAWDASRGRSVSAVFHAIAAMALAAPLIGESTARFGTVDPTLGAVLLGVFGATGVAIASATGLLLYGIVAAAGAGVAAVVLAVQTTAPAAFCLVGVLLGGLAVAAAKLRDWPELGWAGSIPADVCAFTAVLWASNEIYGGRVSRTAAFAVAVVAVLVFLVPFVVATVRSGRAGALEILQTLAVLGIGFEGAAIAAPGASALHLLGGLGAVGAAAAIAGTARVQALHIQAEQRGDTTLRGDRTAVVYLSFLAVFLAIEGLRRLLPLEVAAVAWAGLALLARVAASSPRLGFLRAHSALLALAAVLESGLAAAIGVGLLADPTGAWSTPGWAAWTALALLAGAAGAAARWPATSLAGRAADLVPFGSALLGACAAIALLLAGPVAAAPGPVAQAGVLAVVRTGLLAAAAVATAAASRRGLRRELAWLTIGVLVAGAVKLAVQDISAGTAATAFAALIAYGAALITAPRLLRPPR
jgi:hypothetical protein